MFQVASLANRLKDPVAIEAYLRGKVCCVGSCVFVFKLTLTYMYIFSWQIDELILLCDDQSTFPLPFNFDPENVGTSRLPLIRLRVMMMERFSLERY